MLTFNRLCSNLAKNNSHIISRNPQFLNLKKNPFDTMHFNDNMINKCGKVNTLNFLMQNNG